MVLSLGLQYLTTGSRLNRKESEARQELMMRVLILEEDFGMVLRVVFQEVVIRQWDSYI